MHLHFLALVRIAGYFICELILLSVFPRGSHTPPERGQ